MYGKEAQKQAMEISVLGKQIDILFEEIYNAIRIWNNSKKENKFNGKKRIRLLRG